MSKARLAVQKANKISDEALKDQAFAALKQKKDLDVRFKDAAILIRHRNEEYSCHVCKAGNINAILRIEVMDLLEDNMREMYSTSSMGWSRREKQGELFDKTGRFIILRSTQGRLVAFTHWRFDCEDCDEDDPHARPEEDIIEVLYCYEVQIRSSHQSQRLGQILMDVLDSIARQSDMKKVMLTVFLSNQAARKFYHRLGYSSDLISPQSDPETNADYDIMSKAVLEK